MARLGDVEFSVITEESPRRETAITDKPVERGGNVADHAQPQPWRLNIVGRVTGPGAGDRFALLQQYWRESRLLTYRGRNHAWNMVIESFPSEHDARVANGFRFSMSLKQIRITQAETVEIVAPDPALPAAPGPPAGNQATGSQTKPREDGGNQQIQEQEPDEERYDSFLKRGWDWAVDLFRRTEPSGEWPPPHER